MNSTRSTSIANDKDGNPLIADTATFVSPPRKSTTARASSAGPISYNDGLNFTSERWPPWPFRAWEYDAGLVFLAYQRDPRTGFVKIFDAMSKLDMLNQFVTHIGGGLFACPGGVADGDFIGQKLFAMG